MKVTKIINLQITNVIETDEFDPDEHNRWCERFIKAMKQHLEFDDVHIIKNKVFFHDERESTVTSCENCVHSELGSQEFPCNECVRWNSEKPNMFIAKGE